MFFQPKPVKKSRDKIILIIHKTSLKIKLRLIKTLEDYVSNFPIHYLLMDEYHRNGNYQRLLSINLATCMCSYGEAVFRRGPNTTLCGLTNGSYVDIFGKRFRRKKSRH